MTNIQQHYQTCSDYKCPLFNREDPLKGCSALKEGNCKYQTIHMLQSADNQYLDGKKHGKHRKWYGNGQLEYECNYVNGKENGLYRYGYGNGQLAKEFNYVDGKKHGKCRVWYSDGKLMHHDNFINGERCGFFYKLFERIREWGRMCL